MKVKRRLASSLYSMRCWLSGDDYGGGSGGRCRGWGGRGAGGKVGVSMVWGREWVLSEVEKLP
jgi:hypothetical protein